MAWIVKKSHEASKEGGAKPIGPFLTTEKVNKMFSLFVDEDKPDDYKCGNCSLRILLDKQDTGDCAIVKGGISLTKGSCSFWTFGQNPSKADGIHPERLDYQDAGYEEVPDPANKIQCGTCYYYETIDDKSGNCLLWKARVKPGNCCAVYKNSNNKVPGVHLNTDKEKS